MTTAVIVLAGGSGSRLGGVDKAILRVDGATLLDKALDAAGCMPVIVVGPARPAIAKRVLAVVQEEPPGGGPAAATVAGLAALPSWVSEVMLLAIDLPRLSDALDPLLDAADGPDGVVAVDADGREQWLLGRYRAAALQDAARALGDPAGRSMRALLGGLDLARLRLPPGLEADVDTVADARAAGVAMPGEEAR